MNALNLEQGRSARLDALRGGAIVWMVAFHFAFDLNWFGWLTPPQQFLADPFWTLQRTTIVTLFVGVAGLTQALAAHSGRPGARFWRRWMQILACALAVSAATALVFPRSWIYFGVLHGMAAMLLLTHLAVWPWWARSGRPKPGAQVALSLLALAALVAPLLLAHPLFNAPWLHWTGLVTADPVTEDYVPLLPWLGVLWGGMVLGALLARCAPDLLARPLPRALAPLAALGRWPLTVYMLHQPLLWGVLATIQHLR